MDFFSIFTSIGCGDDEVAKPNPLALWNLLGEDLKPVSESIYMVGDSPVDVSLAFVRGLNPFMLVGVILQKR